MNPLHLQKREMPVSISFRLSLTIVLIFLTLTKLIFAEDKPIIMFSPVDKEIIASRFKDDTIVYFIRYDDIKDTTIVQAKVSNRFTTNEPRFFMKPFQTTLYPNTTGEVPFIAVIKQDRSMGVEDVVLLSLNVFDKHGNAEMVDQKTIIVKSPIGTVQTADRYSISIGSNLDFESGVSLRDLYGDFRIFVPNAFSYKLGIEGGLIRNRFLTTSQDELSLYPLTGTNYPIIPIDTAHINITGIHYNRNTSRTLSQTNMFLFLPFCISDTISENLDELNLNYSNSFYIGPSFEFIKNSYTETSSITSIRDTSITTIKKSELDTNLAPFDRYRNTVRKWEANEGWFGFGALWVHNSKLALIRAKAIFPGMVVDESGAIYLFYSFSFSIRDNYTGIKVGLELMGRHPTEPPLYSVYLAKEFSIAKFIDFISSR
jgi:hypothetical protein